MHIKDRVISEEELVFRKLKTDLPLVFWGTGNNAQIISRILYQKGIKPTVYCDNNTNNQGKKINDIEVLSYAQIKERYKKYLIVLAVAINNAIVIKQQLIENGEKNEIIHIEKPFKVDEEFLEYSDFLENIDTYDKVYNILEDSLSKDIFVSNINFRLTGNKMQMLEYVDGDTFFDHNLIPYRDDYAYMDVGAYTGDTVLRFYAFSRGKYEHIYAMEPDKDNFLCMENMIKYGRLENVSLFPYGGWEKEDILIFHTVKNETFDSPSFFKETEFTMPSSVGMKKECYTEERVKVDSVDHILDGQAISILKINAMAADFQILKGSAETIRKFHPIIVGEFGTRKENLTDMILYLKHLYSGYKIYLREKLIFGDAKVVYIAIPG